jgi:hypothetical protein
MKKDYSLYDKKYTYEELKKDVDEEYNSMSEDEIHYRLIQNDPTFKLTVLSSMSPENTVILNEETYQYEIT